METEAKKGLAERAFGGDRALWVVIIALSVVSLLVVYSSTASLAYKKFGGDTSHHVANQLVFLVLSFGVMFVTHRINYQTYARFATVAFTFGLALVGMTFFFGVNFNDASRWLPIPGTGYTFQPSDFLKVTLVLVLARQLAKRQKTIAKSPILPPLSPSSWARHGAKNREILFGTTLPLLFPVVASCAVIFFSNFSTSAITFFTCLVMLYIGRVKVGQLGKLVSIVSIVLAVALTVMIIFDIGRARTWGNRIVSFAGLSEQVDSDDDLQVEQAKIAIASGGFFGKGPGHSTQRANLPHSYSDFAYAFIVEEYGVLGALIVLVLYLWIFYRTIIIFQKCGTAFPAFLALGLGLLIVLQAIFNMLVSVNLFPVTGQTLPVISLGGSSLLFTSLALGMILGVSRQTQEKSLDKPKEESLLG